jgi:hypothetical protein
MLNNPAASTVPDSCSPCTAGRAAVRESKDLRGAHRRDGNTPGLDDARSLTDGRVPQLDMPVEENIHSAPPPESATLCEMDPAVTQLTPKRAGARRDPFSCPSDSCSLVLSVRPTFALSRGALDHTGADGSRAMLGRHFA